MTKAVVWDKDIKKSHTVSARIRRGMKLLWFFPRAVEIDSFEKTLSSLKEQKFLAAKTACVLVISHTDEQAGRALTCGGTLPTHWFSIAGSDLCLFWYGCNTSKMLEAYGLNGAHFDIISVATKIQLFGTSSVKYFWKMLGRNILQCPPTLASLSKSINEAYDLGLDKIADRLSADNHRKPEFDRINYGWMSEQRDSMIFQEGRRYAD